MPSGQDIVDVIAGSPGPKSDINLFRKSKKKFDAQQKFQGDKGYQGEPSIKTPVKKPKTGELTLSQKEKNKEMSSDRIFGEHLIRVIDISEKYQYRSLTGFNQAIARAQTSVTLNAKIRF